MNLRKKKDEIYKKIFRPDSLPSLNLKLNRIEVALI
jgi:hypothetical protein